jgi:hypothetical protein
MLDLSWHTHQINLWIALSNFEPTFSTTLAELGYECDVIEHKLYLENGTGEETIHPDVVLTSASEEHALVIDCKAEKVDSDQLGRYLDIDGEQEQLVVQGLVRDVAASSVTSETLLSSFSKLSSDDIPDEIGVVHFDQDPYSGLAIWNLDKHPLNHEPTSDLFPINVNPDQPLPTHYYPFDVYEADKEAMVSSVFSAVMSLAMDKGEFSIEEILNKSHPYWDKVGDDKQEELAEGVNTIYLELLEAGLDEYLEKISGTQGKEWKRTSATIQAIHGETEYYVSRVVDELPQARLDHYAWTTESSQEEKDE